MTEQTRPVSSGVEPATFSFDDESREEIARILKKYPESRKASAVLPVLYVVQNQMKRQTDSAWVPRVAMDEVALLLGIAPMRVYEVANFYTMFNKKPIGRYHLQVCTTTSCWLRGSDDVVAACMKEGGIDGFGQTSADGMFTLSEVECLGACANAPVLQVDNDYYEDLNEERTVELLRALRRGEKPKPGPTVERLNSAPEGGRTTLLDQGPAKKPVEPS